MKCIGQDIDHGGSIMPAAYRREIVDRLLLKSADVKNPCLQCFGRFNSTASKVACTMCKCRIHTECIRQNALDTETEERESVLTHRKSYVTQKSNKNCKQYSNLYTYTRRLCKRYIK